MAADTFQIKRGTTAAVNAYLPAVGEPVYDITLKKLKIGDGITLGGVESTPANANLAALAGLTGAADKGFYFTGVGAMALFDLTTVARTLLAQTTTTLQRSTLGLAIGTDVQAFDSDLSALATNSTNGLWARTGAGTGSARTITGTANEITVTNGDGVAGAPTLSVPTSLNYAGKTFTNAGIMTTVDINGGTIDGAVIGGASAAAGTFTTGVFTSTITPSQTAGIVGTTTNNNANTGSVGEYVTANASAVAITVAGTVVNVTSISLTAGDWEVFGSVGFVPAGTTTVSQVIGGINTTSATLSTSDFNNANLQATLTTGAKQSLAVPSQRLSLASTTTVYLVATATFAVSTITANGIIRARRVR